ncbi:MAG: DUF3108 domain-containing protein [Verrucomicrobia subdivision 3 bacterium]|nr:DUF3108 domain-containing protein [Limisphaerales bacterium]
MKRGALIGIIVFSSAGCLWLLLAWLSITESTYRQPAISRAEAKAVAAPQGIYQPEHFTDGEMSAYKIRLENGFLVLPAGKVTFAVRKLDRNGMALWEFTLKGGAIGGLIHYDATSIVNASFTHSREYHTVQSDLSSRKVDLAFDEKNRVCKRTLDGHPDGQVVTEMETLDPLSIIFKFREMNLAAASKFSSAVSDGKATFPVTVNVVGKQAIKIGGQAYHTILVEPDLGNFRGIFKKNPNAKLQIWLSDDAHRIPLRIKTKIKHGTFIAELEKYQRPRQPNSPSAVATTSRLIKLIISGAVFIFLVGFFLRRN